MSKEDFGLKIFRHPFMIRKLFTVVCGDRVSSLHMRLEQLNDRIGYRFGRFAVDFLQEGQAGFPVRQGDDGMPMPFSNDGVHFPISQALAGIHNCRPFVDAYPVFELPPPVVAPVALPALLLAA